jgi:hypothetical protein
MQRGTDSAELNRSSCTVRRSDGDRDSFLACPLISVMARAEQSAGSPGGLLVAPSATRCWKGSIIGMLCGSRLHSWRSASPSSPTSSNSTQGEPVNEKHAERRAAAWLYQYCTGDLPPGEPELQAWECALY